MPETVKITIADQKGNKTELQAPVGMDLLTVLHKNKVDIEGACEGSLACSTCHVYIDDSYFEKLPEASEDEEDMLDAAYELRDNSRLSCQIKVTQELDGMIITLPNGSKNLS